MKSRLIPLALVLLTACGGGLGSYFAPTAAVVNGRKIPESDMSVELRVILQGNQDPTLFVGNQGATNRLEAQRRVLSDLVQVTVVVQEAEKLGLNVSAEEIGGRLDAVRAQFGGEEQLTKELENRGLTLAYVERRFRDQILFEKVQQELTKDIVASEEEVRQAFESRKADFDGQIRVAHILICSEFDQQSRSCLISEKDESLAVTIASRAKGGEEFASLAAEYSIDSSNKDLGGDLGFHRRGEFVKEFEDAAYALEVGAVSDPVKTAFGIHVIKVIAKGRVFEDVRGDLAAELAAPRRREAFQNWLRDALGKAKVTVNPRYGKFDRTTFTVVEAQTAKVPAPNDETPQRIGIP